MNRESQIDIYVIFYFNILMWESFKMILHITSTMYVLLREMCDVVHVFKAACIDVRQGPSVKLVAYSDTPRIVQYVYTYTTYYKIICFIMILKIFIYFIRQKYIYDLSYIISFAYITLSWLWLRVCLSVFLFIFMCHSIRFRKIYVRLYIRNEAIKLWHTDIVECCKNDYNSKLKIYTHLHFWKLFLYFILLRFFFILLFYLFRWRGENENKNWDLIKYSSYVFFFLFLIRLLR